MANLAINQLPTAQTLTGQELVPVVQNGTTVQTTTGAIANSPVLNQTFLTVGAQPGLANSRYIGVGAGLGSVDTGAAGLFSINLADAPLSLVTSGVGFQVKTGPNTLTGRSIAVGNGLGVSNADGISGDPLITYAGLMSNLASLSGAGLIAINGTTATPVDITGTANQTTVTNGNGVGNPTIGLANNLIAPGSGSLTLPFGNLAQRPTGSVGQIRYNSDLSSFEGYTSTGWGSIVAGVAVTLINTGTGLTGGPITSAGTISLANTTVSPATYGSATQVGQFTVNAQGQLTFAGNVAISPASIGAVTSVSGTANEITATGVSAVTLSLPTALTFTGKTVTGGAFNMTSATVGADTVTTNTTAQVLTGKSISGTTNTLSAIANASLTNSSVTYNGVAVALGASGTITAVNPNTLTIGTGLLGTSYNGAANVTVSINSTVATLTGAQTLTNKAISGSTNTLTAIANASLTNSSVTYGTTVVALGASSATLGGLTSVAVTQDPTTALQLATKQYVDAAVSSLNIHVPSVAGTTANLTSTYNNGSSGVGATLTNTGTLVAFATDGYTALLNDRILVKNQSAAAQNGVYTVTTLGSGSVAWVLTRATDYDTAGPSDNQIGPGDYIYVQNGTTLSATGWVMTTPVPITIGTTAIAFTQFSGVGTYTAGTGLTLTGTLFSITNTAVSAATYGSASSVPVFAVNAQGQLTSVTNTPIVIANTAVTGLGTMSTQAANSVAITGGAINGTTIGATTASTGAFTTLTASSTATLNTLVSSGATITGGTINNATIGATTATTGRFTTVTATSGISGGTF